MNQPNINLQAMMNKQFDIAKLNLNLSTLCGLIILGLDVIVTFAGIFEEWLALIAALLIILSSIFSWRSARLRDSAELILRRFDMYNGLGWSIDRAEMSDLRAAASESVKRAAKTPALASTYFTDQSTTGTQKLLKNLEESAWCTKQQALRMSQYTGIFSVIVFVLALITLIIALQSTLDLNTSNSIAKVTISVIVFVVSGGYVRQAFDYKLLAEDANQAERRAIELGKSNPTVEEAINALHDYQIARTVAPLLPSWLWKLVQKELNELWEQRIA